jgi:AcrR family transcriptional regulator
LLPVRSAESARALPRGPHGLSREEVERSQRERLLTAMADAVAAKGYIDTTVADVIARAGVSRASFYLLFSDKADCFRATYESAADLIVQVLADALDERRSAASPDLDVTPLALLDHVLTTYLDQLQRAPSLARTFLVEVYAAGPRVIEQRRASMEAFVDLVAETHRGETGLLGTEPDQRFAAEALVGAVSSMVTNLVGAGELDRVAQLREPLLRLAEQLTRRERS